MKAGESLGVWRYLLRVSAVVDSRSFEGHWITNKAYIPAVCDHGVPFSAFRTLCAYCLNVRLTLQHDKASPLGLGQIAGGKERQSNIEHAVECGLRGVNCGLLDTHLNSLETSNIRNPFHIPFASTISDQTSNWYRKREILPIDSTGYQQADEVRDRVC